MPRKGRVVGRVWVANEQEEFPALGLTVAALHVSDAGAAGPVRLGSAEVDSAGRFAIAYEQAELTDLHLQVAVRAPDGDDSRGKLLFESEVRRAAGPEESFSIRLGAESSRVPGIARRDVATEAIRELTARQAIRDVVDDGINRLATARLEKLIARRAESELARPKLIQALSRVPTGALDALSRVREGERISDAAARTTARMRDELTSEARRWRGRITLGEDEAPAVGDLVDAETFDRWFKRDNAEVTRRLDLLRITPLEHARRTDLAPHETVPELSPFPLPTPPPPSGGGSDPEELPLDPTDDRDEIQRRLNLALSRLVASVAGDGSGAPDSAGRAEPKDLDAFVTGFQLAGGPADVPSFHDFYTLHLASQPVWQELLDEQVVEAAVNAHANTVVMGGRSGLEGVRAVVVEGMMVGAARDEEVPATILRFFEISARVWAAMSDAHRLTLGNIADGLQSITARQLDFAVLAKAMGLTAFSNPPLGSGFMGVWNEGDFQRFDRQLRDQGERLIAFTQRLLEERAGSSFGSYHPVLADLAKKINEPYSFVAYAADGVERHINYGIRLQWRLKLEPRNYQVGELVRSIPLGPGETRKVSIRSQTVKKRTKTLSTLAASDSSFERSETVRAEEEILRRAQQATKFSLTAAGDYDIGISEGTATSTLAHDVSRDASDSKRRMREAAIKEAQAVKNEMKTEVVTSEEATFEHTEEMTLNNSNDQITCNFVYYLLQRRCTMTQSLHRAMPVVFVAQELPRRIDKVWLIQHAPVLRQVLLDATLLPALDDLCHRTVGDEFAVEQLRISLAQRRKMVEAIREDLAGLKTATARRLNQLRAAMEKQASLQEADDGQGWATGLWENLVFGDISPEAARMRMEAAREDFERAETAERDLVVKFERELGALEAAQKEYTAALRQQLDRESRIEQLRLHVMQYLLVYLKAIWMVEPAAQRELRLRNAPAPWIEGDRTYRVVQTVAPAEAVGRWTGTTFELEPEFTATGETTVPLGTIADLRTLIGVEGNYLVFPLKEHTLVTEFMLTPFFHPELGLRDPDELGWAVADFHRYARALKDTDPDGFEAALPRLTELEAMLRSSPRRETEDVIIPTGALFVEALPGRHTVMQEDSLFHRKMDALKAAVDVQNQQHLTRSSALENLRYAQRLLDGETGDPEAEVRVEGNGAVVVPIPTPPGPPGPS